MAEVLYSGITRGKRLVLLIRQRKANGIALRGGNLKLQWTKLGQGCSPLTELRLETLT